MKTNQQKGWIMALSRLSDWGSVERFYDLMRDTAAAEETFVIDSDVWGRLRNKDMNPCKGDGIAFYHSRKAQFPKGDPHHRRPRISLLGSIEDIERNGQDVTHLTARVRSADLERLRVTPIIRDNDTENMFRECGMVQGSVATFYEAPPTVWAEFQTLAGMRPDDPATSAPHAALDDATYREGAPISALISDYERNPEARTRCIEHWGVSCAACGMDFGETYGDIGNGFIHVHHLTPLSEMRGDHVLNPIHDLRPLCPNCHAMAHRRDPPLTIEELQEMLRRSGRLG